ncbi:MAG: archease [Nitrospiraceae bacterium]
MGARFTFLDDIALADMAFEATGDSPVELLESATSALIESLANPHTIEQSWHHPIDRHAHEVSSLLFDWLEEMVYLKDAHGVVFHHASLILDRRPPQGIWHLHGELVGAPVHPGTQELRSDVKGVTKHLYEVSECCGAWRARVVLDV